LIAQKNKINRIEALDALRGIAILGMVFSGTIPFDGSLPGWMYHAQEPPPTYHFNPNLAGISWVDLVFPCFIFALGCAIPLALSRRLEKKQSLFKILGEISKRSFLLFSFAIITQHFRPLVINPDPGKYTWLLALLGYVLLFLMYVQLPKYFPKKLQYLINILGWSGGIFLLSRLKYLEDHKYPAFSLYRSDIILLVLANLVFFTSLIWLFTRKNPEIRLLILLPLSALIISFNNGGWNTQFLKHFPLPWLFNFDYLKYLFIALPATVVGDWLSQNNSQSKAKWKRSNLIILIASLLSLILSVLYGLYTRQFGLMSILILLLILPCFLLLKDPGNSIEIVLNRLYGWAIYCLIVGLSFEPLQGGIKKDSATFSYYFVTMALAIFLLMIFLIAINLLNLGSYLSILISNGKNPMLAYVSFGNLLWPILSLNHWEEPIAQWIHGNALAGLFKGIIYTLIVALWTSLWTRWQFFWKT